MRHSFELKHSTLCLFLAATLYACNSSDDGPAPEPIEDPEPEPKTTITIPDSVFEQRLISHGVDTDGEVNGQIWLEDALAVTQLELFSTDDQAKITDLTGIEAFKNLKALSVHSNALQTISLSENTALEMLTLNFNQLTSIDLSANIALERLSIARNDLETIDLSANVNLVFLDLHANNLQSLDISNNTELVELNVIVNELSTIEGLNQATKLEKLNLAWNYFEELTLNLPALTGLNVEQNQLNTLNIDGSPSLEYLLATVNQLQSLNTDNNPALKHLKVSYNDIIELDLTNNTNLEMLWASGNELSSLDVSELKGLYDLRIVRNADLTCIQIASGQEIPTLQIENHQSLSTESCN